MTPFLIRLARSVIRRPAHWLAPLAGAVFLGSAIVSELGRGPWPDLLGLFIPLAIMIGVAPFLPAASLALMVLVPLCQLGGLIVDASANTWPVYLSIPISALVLGFSAEGGVRRAILPVGLVSATVIAFLISVPQHDEGGWSNWIGLVGYSRLHPRQDDFIGAAFVGLGLFILAWGIGLLFRYGSQGRFTRFFQLFQNPPAPSEAMGGTPGSLTVREGEIYALVAKGLSNAEIAAHEHISETTVKSHVRAILRKLDLRSRSQIAAHAHERRDVVESLA